MSSSVSRRFRLTAGKRVSRPILYVMPAMMDCISGIFIFIGPVRAAAMGYDPLVAGSLVTTRSVTCCLFGFIASRLLSIGNAARLMRLGMILLFGVCLLGTMADNLAMLYLTTALVGAFQVIFFAAFQIFIKAADSGEARPLSRVMGDYTLAWCLGMAFGPFLTGFLMRLDGPAAGGGEPRGWIYAYLAAGVLALAIMAALAWVTRKSGGLQGLGRETPPPREGRPEDARPPDLAWLGWSMGFLGAIAFGVVKGVFPSEITRAGMPEWRAGSIMMALSLATGICAFLASFRRSWLYSGAAMGVMGLAGAAGLALFILPSRLGLEPPGGFPLFYAGAALFGAYCGVFFLYSGFHALAHPEKAGRNISFNECFLAGGGIIGPLLGGWLAKQHGFAAPFGLAATLILSFALFQWLAHRGYAAQK